ncbi:hypothetical protein Q1695_007183 [Nippostrongylus brasiliensis]|nr:hypothetical protein Q1695_007183 [Nippostrongylus brasiliensis]
MVLALSGGRQPSCVVEQVPKSPQLGQQSGLSLPLVEPDVAWRNCTLADRFCSDQNHADWPKALQLVSAPRTQYVLVRNPIDRFLSGFVNKCIVDARLNPNECFACKGNMSCFVDRLTQHLHSVHNDNLGNTYQASHFGPQTWHCRFNETIDQLKVIKYRGGKEGAAYLAGEFNRIFREAGVPEHIRHEISKEMLAGKTVHTTYGSEDRREAERTLMGNITLLTEVVRLYYYDFVLFDYELPSMF